uniref:Ribosomal protein L16 n=1 Tax=Erodium foetidum subsp. foetidum TaxID=337375 RepID=A0A096XCR1_9ROSI|nr:ribosomal protein L16 [Erodium foetidum subsp. foetidum]
MLSPKRTKFRKEHRGKMRGVASRGSCISFGRYALQALEPAWITSRQIEAGRRAMTRNVRRGGKIWVRIFPDKPVTVRSAETRMGSGKGSPEYWVAVVKPGRILYEMGGVAENIARKAIEIAGSKMPIRTQFISRDRDVEPKEESFRKVNSYKQEIPIEGEDSNGTTK